jgi:hypothetical protein
VAILATLTLDPLWTARIATNLPGALEDGRSRPDERPKRTAVTAGTADMEGALRCVKQFK